MELILQYIEIGLEVNADKTKYMLKSPDQNTGRSYNIKTDNNSFDKVEQFKYLRKIFILAHFSKPKFIFISLMFLLPTNALLFTHIKC